nr:enoyl-[acyl-carrier-protein] reductase [NADH], chloroplastic-like [Ipomoea batatas]
MRYLAALSASSYSYISLLKHFLPIMNPGGASLSLTYIASERIIPGYGGGMSSAKYALESDTRRKILSGPLRSRAAKAIGFIDMMIDYSIENAPLQKELSAEEVGNAAAFLASPLASAIMGAVVYVDNGLMQWEWELTVQCLRILTTPKTRAMRLLNKLFLCEFVQILTSKISNGLSIACHFLFSCPSNRPVD